jgi:hypothetical protein
MEDYESNENLCRPDKISYVRTYPLADETGGAVLPRIEIEKDGL